MIDGLVDLVDHDLEVPRGQIVVLRESGLEGLKLVFELGDIDILRLTCLACFQNRAPRRERLTASRLPAHGVGRPAFEGAQATQAQVSGMPAVVRRSLRLPSYACDRYRCGRA